MSENDKGIGDDLRDNFEKAAEKAKEAAGKAGEAAEEAAKNVKESWNELQHSKNNKRILAGVLAIILGGLGIHKFVLGYNQEGVILLVASLVVSFFSFGLFNLAIWVITLTEGIIYLSKTDSEFYFTYQENKRPWF